MIYIIKYVMRYDLTVFYTDRSIQHVCMYAL